MRNKLKKITRLFNEFGLTFSIKYLFFKILHKDEKYIKLVYEYLLNSMLQLIKKYNAMDNKKIEKSQDNIIPVWVCWWQGYDSMPDLCKMFYHRLEKMLPPNSKLILITLENYLEYANIPKVILDKFNSGFISMTTYSDVLRNYLIRDNGGLWIDASIFVSKNLSEDFFYNKEWWSVNIHTNNEKITNLGQKISERRWSGFLQKGETNNILNSFLCDAFLLYYKEHNYLIDYFIQNFLIKVAYNNIDEIHNIIDKIPINNNNVYTLYDNIDNEFDEKTYNYWNQNTSFYKLTQKRKYNIKNIENKLTYYGAIKNICGKVMGSRDEEN